MASTPHKKMLRFKNPSPKPYLIEFDCPEFTCLCPMTGQPDFATFKIAYVPHKFCVELKSLKLFLWSFRNEGHFHEAVTNQITGELSKLLSPKYLAVTGHFFVRGGISTKVKVQQGVFPKQLVQEL